MVGLSLLLGLFLGPPTQSPIRHTTYPRVGVRAMTLVLHVSFPSWLRCSRPDLFVASRPSSVLSYVDGKSSCVFMRLWF